MDSLSLEIVQMLRSPKMDTAEMHNILDMIDWKLEEMSELTVPQGKEREQFLKEVYLSVGMLKFMRLCIEETIRHKERR